MGSRQITVNHEDRKASVNGAVESMADAPAGADVETLRRCEFEVFETKLMPRRELKNAPYNPRKITEAARRKLKTGIAKLGLLAPVIWNKRSGNLVGGHQRLSVLDALQGSPDYAITVAVVDLDAKREREANRLLNNTSAQGEDDLAKLGAMFQETFDGKPLDLDATGDDPADLYRMFGDSPFLKRDDNQLDNLAERLRATRTRIEQVSRASQAKDDGQGYVVIVFGETPERDEWLTALGLEINRYQSGKVLRRVFEGAAAQISEQAEVRAGTLLEALSVEERADALAAALEEAGRGEDAGVVRALALKGQR